MRGNHLITDGAIIVDKYGFYFIYTLVKMSSSSRILYMAHPTEGRASIPEAELNEELLNSLSQIKLCHPSLSVMNDRRYHLLHEGIKYPTLPQRMHMVGVKSICESYPTDGHEDVAPCMSMTLVMQTSQGKLVILA